MTNNYIISPLHVKLIQSKYSERKISAKVWFDLQKQTFWKSIPACFLSSIWPQNWKGHLFHEYIIYLLFIVNLLITATSLELEYLPRTAPGSLHIRLYRPLVDWFLAYISQSVIFLKYSEMFFTRSFVHRVVPQLKGTNPVLTPELLPLPSRAQRKPSSRLERRWASPAAQDTSCTANPPSAASQGIRLSGAERRLHAGVGTAMLRNK